MERKKLGLIEKYLTLWIFLAIIFGVALGYVYPEISGILAMMSIDTTSIPRTCQLGNTLRFFT